MIYGYTSLESEVSIYIKWDNNNDTIIIIAVYVDDLQIACNDTNILSQARAELQAQFKMMDLGEVHHILGLYILWNDTQTLIDQTHYLKGILEKNNMHECILVNMPMEMNIKL